MKMFITIVAAALFVATTCMAQSYADLAKAQKQMDKLNRELAYPKPTKEDKKEAKKLQKDKWQTLAGEDPIDIQIHKARLYGACLMSDDDMNPTKRFILRTATATAGSEVDASSAAIFSAQTDIASLLQTQLISAMERVSDNAQSSAINAVTVNKFHQRAKAIVETCLTNMQTPVTIYRVMPNGNYQVQVRVAYDKMELKRRLIKKMQQELELEGDASLNGLVDNAINPMEN